MEDILNGPAKAELERIGAAHGLVDPDALRLADLAGVSVDADGKVTGAAEAIEKLKEAKGYLFKRRTARDMTEAERIQALRDIIARADRPQRAAVPGTNIGKSAKEMTPAERKAWLADHSRRHG